MQGWAVANKVVTLVVKRAGSSVRKRSAITRARLGSLRSGWTLLQDPCCLSCMTGNSYDRLRYSVRTRRAKTNTEGRLYDILLITLGASEICGSSSAVCRYVLIAEGWNLERDRRLHVDHTRVPTDSVIIVPNIPQEIG